MNFRRGRMQSFPTMNRREGRLMPREPVGQPRTTPPSASEEHFITSAFSPLARRGWLMFNLSKAHGRGLTPARD